MKRRRFIQAGALTALSAQLPAAKAASTLAGRRQFRETMPAGLNDCRRFLDQATMGPQPGEAMALTGSFENWIEAQIALPYTPIDHDIAWTNNFRNNMRGNYLTRVGVFARWCNEEAQLRMRVAHVLQQIVCAGSRLGQHTLDSLLWWNGLMARAFQNYRDVLRMAITHRYMGGYLNNFGNKASNGIQPSANLARELLQLFSTGVDRLNPDGSVVRDRFGQPVPAYAQADIDALAKLLCGWSLPYGNEAAGRDGTPADGTMVVAPSIAYNGPAVSFMGRRFPQVQPSSADVLGRMESCLDLIMAHPSVPPYVSRQFIKKMVTDSPSPAYVARVSAVFANNGAGVRGDLRAVVMAVLLDDEARGNAKPASFGRAQEWVLSLTRGMRYAQMETMYDAYSSRSGFGNAWATNEGDPAADVLGELGQTPMTVGSVFNDYPHQYVVNGVEAPAAAMWRAPEILAHVGITLSLSSRLGNPNPSVPLDFTGRWLLTALLQQFQKVEAGTIGTRAQKQRAAVATVVDQVFADLNQGRQMTPFARSQLIDFIDIDCAPLPLREKLAWLVNMVRCLPEHAVII